MACNQSQRQIIMHEKEKGQEEEEPSIDTDKLSYEIFSILESKFLFGYDGNDDHQKSLYIPNININSSINTTLSSIKNQRGKVCILSIDSAGMRGILPGKALSYLENSLKQKSGNLDAKIADFFDVATGSGVGGIFTSMIFASKDCCRPVFSAEDTWKLLAEQGRKFYSSGDAWFKRLFGGGGACSLSLKDVLKEAFSDKGRCLTLRDTLKPVLIPCYDMLSTAPFLFSRADAFETESFDFRLWEVCRATSAEPGLFEPVAMRSVDGRTGCVGVGGGLAMSNPTAAAITHVLHNKQEFPFVRGVEDLLVLSLGTGQVLDVRYEFDQVKRWRAKEWARPMARISGDGSADMVDQAVAMAFGEFRSSNYVRIQAHGSSMGRYGPNVDTNASPKNVKMLIFTAEEMLKQKNVESVLFGGKKIGEQSNFEKLDWFAGELVQEHQRRSCRIAPTVAFKQSALKPT